MILLQNRNTKTRQYDQFLSSAAGPLFLRSMASKKILLTKHTIRSLLQPTLFSSSAANKTTKHKTTTSAENTPTKKDVAKNKGKKDKKRESICTSLCSHGFQRERKLREWENCSKLQLLTLQPKTGKLITIPRVLTFQFPEILGHLVN